MAVDPRVAPDVLQAAIRNAGEIKRHYPHSDTDFETDVSAMLAAAFEEFFRAGKPWAIIL